MTLDNPYIPTEQEEANTLRLVLAERERCAKLVENWDSIAQVNDLEEIAAAIRSGK